MPQTLILRLPAHGQDETEWLMLDEAGEAVLTRQRGSLTLAAAVYRSGRLVVLAPAQQILLAEPELPPGAGAKIARAVPFALEEQLTEDIDHLSFALGQRRDGGGTPVTVVARSVLDGWLADLRSAGLEPQAIYPDISLMPENPGSDRVVAGGRPLGRAAAGRPALRRRTLAGQGSVGGRRRHCRSARTGGGCGRAPARKRAAVHHPRGLGGDARTKLKPWWRNSPR